MLCHMPLLSRWNRKMDNETWRYFPPLSVHAFSFGKLYLSFGETFFPLEGFSYFEWYGYLPFFSFSLVVDTFPFTVNSFL